MGPFLGPALRQMRARPLFAAAVILTFAVAIGLNTASFTLVNTLLLRPLPGFETDRIVVIWLKTPKEAFNAVDGETVRQWRAQAKSFERIEAGTQFPRNLTGAGSAETIRVAAMTAGYFRLYRAQPLAGRTFLPEEEKPGALPVAVLDYGLWQRKFGGDTRVVGQTITLDRKPHTVIGVLPEGFHPIGAGIVAAYVPLVMEQLPAWNFWTVARLSSGVSLESARAEMAVISRNPARANSKLYEGTEANVVPMIHMWQRDVRSALWLLFGATALVLLIACANIGNLLLVRGTERAKEFAIRRALGASRARLIRDAVAESAILAAVGGTIGLLLARWAIVALARANPDGLPRAEELRIDGWVTAFSLAATLAAAALASLWPAVRSTAAQWTARGAASSPVPARPRRILVAAQTGLALMLVSSAALLARSLGNLERVELGYDPRNLLTLMVTLPESVATDAPAVLVRYRRLLDELSRTTGVESAALSTRLPIGGAGLTFAIRVAGKPEPPRDTPEAEASVVSDEYFQTMRIRLLRGRTFDRLDRAGRAPTVVINEAVARTFFPGVDPIGRHLMIETFDPAVTGTGPRIPREIVGVVAGTRNESLRTAPPFQIYLPVEQTPVRFTGVAIRTRAGTAGLEDAVRRAITAADAELAISELATQDALLDRTLAATRRSIALTGAFAVIGLLLALVGVYGVTAYVTASRTAEIGVRMALGATPSAILQLTLGEALVTGLAGLIAGLAGALAIGRLLEAHLYGVPPADAFTLSAVSAFLALLLAASAFRPALAAARTDAASALRAGAD